MKKQFISQNLSSVNIPPFPKNTVLLAICSYNENTDEFHAILQLAKPTALDSSGYYNSLSAVVAPTDINIVEEVNRLSPFYGYPIAFNISEFPNPEFRSYLLQEILFMMNWMHQ